MSHLSRAVLCLLCGATLAPAATKSVSFTVAAGKYDRKDEVVRVPVNLPKGVHVNAVEIRDAKGKAFAVGQVTHAGLASPASGHELFFVLPALKAGATLDLSAEMTLGERAKPGPDDFHWSEGKELTSLSRGERPVLRYNRPTLDDSSPKAREATFKVFHEVYAPDGSALVTKGVGGEFTHHRGLFYGFMKATYGKNTVDIWHCKGDTHQAPKGAAHVEAGPVLGRHTVRIDWNGVKKETFATEERQVAAFALPGGTLIEFASKLTPTDVPVKLDGDPQHAGFHFRASNEVAAKNKNQTIFVRPNGPGKPGTEVNWPGDKKHVDLPWLGMSFVVDGKRYTAAYLDRPTNPKQARFSERTYGRVGSYFVTTATKEKPLGVVYRVWLQEGEMTPAEIAAKSRAFVEPVEVTVK
jgi:hypothetical protein